MKKLFTFFATAMMAFTALATDYTGTLVVTVNGEVTKVPGTGISVTNDGSNYTLSVINFMLPVDGGDPIGVGNITLNTQAVKNNNLALLKVDQDITIAEGNDPNVDFWLGPTLGDVPIKMTSLVADNAAYVNIDIELTEMEQTINVKFLTDGFQIPNSDFEDWEYTNPSTGAVTTKNEPRNWHGFKSAKGSYAGAAQSTLARDTDKRTGSSGTYSAVITAGSVLGIINNGTITNGQLNAASMSASNTANHSEMDKSSTATDQYGDKFYTHFIGRPDAVKTWIKFTQGTAQSTYKYANFSAIIFDGSYYQDPEDKTYTNVTAKAQNKQITTCGWTELTVPFTGYTSVAPEAILLTVATNATPGKGSKGDKVWIDDMEIVYNGEVTGITVNGLDGFTFNAATTDYTIESDAVISESDITVQKTGLYSYLFKSVEETQNGQLITVIVAPNDMSKLSMYTINVTRPIAPLYVMGEVNGNNWDYNVGAEMTYNAEAEQYELDVHAGLNEDSKWAYFSLTKGFGDDWTATNALRLGGAAPAYNNCEVTAANQSGIALLPFNGETEEGGKTFQIPAGDYKFIVNKDMTVFKVEGDIVVPIDEMYIAGTFTGWNDNKQQMAYDAETESYSITVEGIENGAQFKFIKNNEWYGADSDTDTHIVHPDWCTDIQLTTPGKNFEVNGQGDLTFTVDKDMRLTITGWTPAGVTLAEALAGENGDKLIISDMAVVVANDNYAIVTDGQDNWLKVTGMNDVNEGSYITNLRGTLSDVALNPVLAATAVEPIPAASITVTPKRLNLGTIHRTALTELKPNEVAQFVGYYVAERGELCAFSSGNGLHLEMTMDNMVGQIVDGKQQTITAVVSLKAAWDAPAGAPARVAINDDQAFENISIDATAASVPTGLDTVKAIDGKEIQGIYNVNGQQVNRAERGIYIIRYTDGTATKVQF